MQSYSDYPRCPIYEYLTLDERARSKIVMLRRSVMLSRFVLLHLERWEPTGSVGEQ